MLQKDERTNIGTKSVHSSVRTNVFDHICGGPLSFYGFCQITNAHVFVIWQNNSAGVHVIWNNGYAGVHVIWQN